MVIHLIAAGKLENPDSWSDTWYKCYNIWKSSPHKVKLWGDKDIDDFLKEDDGEFFSILNTLHPVYKWDYVRYLMLEKLGGAYFDMDVEIVDGSFLNILNPRKMYFMEGTLGSYLENSIMISSKSPVYNKDLFYRIKTYIKRKIITNIEDCTKFNVIKYVGAYALSDYFSRYIHETRLKFEILGQYQFSSKTSEIVYTRHHQTSIWND